MVIKYSLRILFILFLLYAGWYVFSFINAWLGIFMIIATIIGVLTYFEKIFNKSIKD